MRLNLLKRAAKTAAVTVTALIATALGAVFAPAPAQATSANCLWYSVGPTNPGLQYRTCAFGFPDYLEGTVWVTNNGAASHYILKLEVFTDLGGWNTCHVGAWLKPGQSRSCTTLPVFMNLPPTVRMAHGRPYYWAPALGAYDWRQGPSLPVYVP